MGPPAAILGCAAVFPPLEAAMGLPQTARALCTDLYELTMAAAYFELGLRQTAAFDLTVRSLPPGRSYLVCAGLEQALAYLDALRFTGEQIDYLRALPVFAGAGREFFDYLAGLEFTGNVRAVPEGTLVFAGEPLLSIEAPLIEAQMVETFLLSMVQFQTTIATKAARVAGAARLDGRERTVAEFGARRAHGPDAGVLAARAAYVGGCAGTSNVEAACRFGIPPSGTEAHSFVMAFEDEEDAFRSYYRCFGDRSILLIDTYDTLAGARKALRAAPRMRGVRIDSGDLCALSRKVRRILDQGGRRDALIVASGDLDEHAIANLVRAGARIDAFGVGTRMVTSEDAPSLSAVYKLVAVRGDGGWSPRAKLSKGKRTYPGRKSVRRFFEPSSGQMVHDLVAAADEACPEGAEDLLVTVMEGGQACAPPPELVAVRARAAAQLARLPEEHRRLRDPVPYPVRFSERLQAALRSLSEQAKGEEAR